ncbi:hypothetical protein [Pediococcus claussenii]|nr:hypothetical protein [Pediococcus claussenii]
MTELEKLSGLTSNNEMNKSQNLMTSAMMTSGITTTSGLKMTTASK